MLKTLGFYLAFVAAITTVVCVIAFASGHPIVLSAVDFKPALAVGVFGVILMVAAYSEKRAWNNGICAQTGQPWQHFDCDSQGGRGYKSGEHTIWISYPVDNPLAA